MSMIHDRLRVGRGITRRSTLTAIAQMVLATIALTTTPANAGGMAFAGDSYQLSVTSLRDKKLQSTLIQQFDFSCGSAAVATLLTYQYDYPVTEQAVFEEMFNRGDQSTIRQQGFSLLDMKNYLAHHGFEADGFEQSLDKLLTAKLPAIVLINDKGYNHFVVVKGLRDDRVLISDPASGTRALPRRAFESIWVSGLLFVIHNATQRAKFDDTASWQAAPRAPLGTANGEQLRLIALPRLSPGDF